MEKMKILVASRDPGLADVRRAALEDAGFEVVSASNITEVEAACKEHKISLVMVGHSVSLPEQRRVYNSVREHCGTPVLQLFSNGEHELTWGERTERFHGSPTPEDFMAAVKFALACAA